MRHFSRFRGDDGIKHKSEFRSRTKQAVEDVSPRLCQRYIVYCSAPRLLSLPRTRNTAASFLGKLLARFAVEESADTKRV